MIRNRSRSSQKLVAVAAALILALSSTASPVFATGEMPAQGEIVTAGQTGLDPVPPEHPPTDTSSTIPQQPDPNTSSDPGGQTSSTPVDPGEVSTPGGEDNGGEDVSSGEEVSSEPNNTEESSTPSRSPSSSSKAPVSVSPPRGVASAPVDSRQPTELSSDDLKGLLSEVPNESNLADAGGFLREDDDSTGSGGLSSLFLGGIALILLGLAGVILFVYRQFLKNKAKPASVTGPIPAVVARSQVKKPAARKDAALPAKRQEALPEQTKAAPAKPSQAKPAQQPTAPSGEYTDITSGRTPGPDADGFDWDKFFKNAPKE